MTSQGHEAFVMELVFISRSRKHAFPVSPLSFPTNFSRGSISTYRAVNRISIVCTLTLWPVNWEMRPHRCCPHTESVFRETGLPELAGLLFRKSGAGTEHPYFFNESPRWFL